MVLNGDRSRGGHRPVFWAAARRLLAQALRPRLLRSKTLNNLVLSNRYIDGKHVALELSSEGGTPLPATASTNVAHEDGFPVPPQNLWKEYGRTSDEYVSSGHRDVETMLRLLRLAGADIGELHRILDFGCAAGRMLRAFPHGGERQLWGVDIDASHISWCENHLSPPFLFATTTMVPHLP